MKRVRCASVANSSSSTHVQVVHNLLNPRRSRCSANLLNREHFANRVFFGKSFKVLKVFNAFSVAKMLKMLILLSQLAQR